ncbi:MAG TPA: hypothetical protein VGM14_25720 [Streptosporangiaceae bacterium]
MRIAAAVNRARTVWVLIAAVALPTAVAVVPAAASTTQGSGLVRGCVNVKTRALTIPAGTGDCGAGTQSLSWQATGPAGPAGIPGGGLAVPGVPDFVDWVVFDGTHLWADAFNNNSVIEVDAGSRTIMRTLSGGSYGFSSPGVMIAGGGDLWVLNTGDSSVTEIRTRDGEFVRKLSGASYGFTAASGLAISNGLLWVTDPVGNSVTEINARNGAIVRKLSGGKYGFKSPSALDFAAGHLWIANRAGNSVTEINPGNGAFIRRLEGMTGPAALASAGSQLWVLGQDDGIFGTGTAFEVDASSGAVTHRLTGADFHMGAPTGAVVVGSKLWISSRDINDSNGGTVEEIDTSSDTFVRHLPRSTIAPGATLAYDGRHLWVGSDELTEFSADSTAAGPSVRGCVDAKTRALTVPAAGANCPSGSAAIGWQQDGPAGPGGADGWPAVLSAASYGFNSPDSGTAAAGRIWVTNARGNSVTELDATDDSLVRVLTGSRYGFSAPVAATANGNLIWIANLDGNSVTELNTSTGALVRVISGTKYGFDQPVSLAFDNGSVWVANAAGNSVTEISAADGSLVRVISAAADHFSQPRAIAGDSAGLWVANSEGNTVTELSASNGSRVRVLPTSDGFADPVGIAADSSHVWVTSNASNNFELGGNITELNAGDGSLVRNLSLSGSNQENGPEGIADDGSHVWVTDDGQNNAVTELDATTGSYLRTINSPVQDDGGIDGFDFTSAFPAGLASFGGHLWITNPGSDTVTVWPQFGATSVQASPVKACVSTSTRAVTVPAAGSGCPASAAAITWNIPGPAGPGVDPGIAPIFSGEQYQLNDPEAMISDGTDLFIANTGGNSVTEMVGSDGSLVRVIQGPSFAFSQPSALISDGGHIWVANTGGNSVTEFNASDGSLVRVVTDPSFNKPSALVSDGSHIWVTNGGGNSVTELNASDGSVVQVVQGTSYAFDNPDALVFDGSNIWVANEFGDSITEIGAADGSFVRNVGGRGSDYGLGLPDAMVFDGTHIWVGNDGNTLTEINASDGSLASDKGNTCAHGLVLDGSHLWAACQGVTEVDLAGNVIGPEGDATDLGTEFGQAVAVAGGHVWVANALPFNDFFVASISELPDN